MINLIPPHARIEVRREYWFRVGVIWLFLVSTALFIVGLLLIPSFVLVGSQLDIYSTEYTTAHNKNDAHDLLEEDVRIANSVAQLLVTDKNRGIYTDIISAITTTAGKSIDINSISITKTDGALDDILVTGTALSRSNLVTFRDTLKNKELFSDVVLPLANLAKDKDVPFQITIIVVSNDDKNI